MPCFEIRQRNAQSGAQFPNIARAAFRHQTQMSTASGRAHEGDTVAASVIQVSEKILPRPRSNHPTVNPLLQMLRGLDGVCLPIGAIVVI
jgi:hypothetical protein